MAIPKWRVASDALDALRKEGKANTRQYYEAYALYYEGLTEMHGDENGYYYGEIKEFKMKAKIEMCKDPNLIAEIIKEVSNKKKHDKYSIAYLNGMMDAYCLENTAWAHLSLRQQILDTFIKLVNDPQRLQRLNNGTCLNHIFSKYL